jgi:hypothetical protein
MRDLGLLEGATPPPAPASPFSLQKRASGGGSSGKAKRALNFSKDDGTSILPDLPFSGSYHDNNADDEDGVWGPVRRRRNGGGRHDSAGTVFSTTSYTHRRKAFTPCSSPLF